MRATVSGVARPCVRIVIGSPGANRPRKKIAASSRRTTNGSTPDMWTPSRSALDRHVTVDGDHHARDIEPFDVRLHNDVALVVEQRQPGRILQNDLFGLLVLLDALRLIFFGARGDQQ